MSSDPGDDDQPVSSGSVDLRREVEDLKGFVKALRRDHEEEVERLHERIEAEAEEKERRISELQHKLEEKDKEIAELKQRTNLLRLVEEEDQIGIDQAKGALIMSLKKKAEQRHERHGKRPAASIDHETAQHVLGHPDVERTTIYKWMKRAAATVDGSALEYDDGKLKINLDAGSVPDQLVTGFTEGGS